MDNVFTDINGLMDEPLIGRTFSVSGRPRHDSAALSDFRGEEAIAAFLARSRDPAALTERISSLLEGIGIRYFGHQAVAGATDALDIFGSYPSQFVDDYIRNRFHLDDFLYLAARDARGKMAPIFQAEITRSLENVPYRSAQMQVNIDLAALQRKHGIDQTCGIPIRDDRRGRHALLRVSACGRSLDEFKGLIDTHFDQLVALGGAIGAVGWSEKFRKSFHNPKLIAHLRVPARPLQLLRVLNKDLTLNEAADMLAISISTANQHIAAAKKALGTTTTHGTLIAAIKEGYLNIT